MISTVAKQSLFCRMEDYDLCSICFAGIGTKAGYIRMDRPVSYKDPVS